MSCLSVHRQKRGSSPTISGLGETATQPKPGVFEDCTLVVTVHQTTRDRTAMPSLGGLLAVLFCVAASAAPAMTGPRAASAVSSITAALPARRPAVATSSAATHAAAAVPAAARTAHAMATVPLTSEEVLQQALASSLSAISAVATSFGARRPSVPGSQQQQQQPQPSTVAAASAPSAATVATPAVVGAVPDAPTTFSITAAAPATTTSNKYQR